MSRRFGSPRDAALAVLTSGADLTENAGSFLGKLVAVGPPRLTAKQAAWLSYLLAEAGLPALRDWSGR